MENSIVLSFDSRGFKRAEKAHEDYKDSILKLKETAKDLKVSLTTKQILDSNSIYVEVAEEVFNNASKGSTLPEGINKMKFLELLDINLVPLSQAANRFNALSTYSEAPNRDAFTRYATSEADIKLYTRLKDTVDSLNELAEEGFVKNKIAISQAFANTISVDRLTTKFKINI